MFTAGEESSGKQIHSYHKIKMMEMITDVLEPEKIKFLRNFTFRKRRACEIANRTEKSPPATKWKIIPRHARDLDHGSQVDAESILDDPYEDGHLNVGESCVRFKVGEVDVISYQNWETAKELSRSQRRGKQIHDVVFDIDNIYVS
ncbi:hypothetical protein Bca101_083157 [Brassica carinata]